MDAQYSQSLFSSTQGARCPLQRPQPTGHRGTTNAGFVTHSPVLAQKSHALSRSLHCTGGEGGRRGCGGCLRQKPHVRLQLSYMRVAYWVLLQKPS